LRDAFLCHPKIARHKKIAYVLIVYCAIFLLIIKNTFLSLRRFIIMDDFVFYSIKEAPFAIYGLYEPCAEGQFRRFPESIAQSLGGWMPELAYNTAGGRVRFKTNSGRMVIRAVTKHKSQMFHATP
jgi:hypothetical protein